MLLSATLLAFSCAALTTRASAQSASDPALPNSDGPRITVMESPGNARRNKPAAPAVTLFVRADREKVLARLTEQMSGKDYRVVKQGRDGIVFSRRTPGAAAAATRLNYDRSLTTPIVDDPRQIVLFSLTPDRDGFVLGARMIETDVVIIGTVVSRDVTRRKEKAAELKRELETLKAAAEKN